MRLNQFSAGLVAIVAAFALNSAQAAEPGSTPTAPTGYFGLMGGLGLASFSKDGISSSTTAFEYGLHMGYDFAPDFSVGVYGLTYAFSSVTSGGITFPNPIATRIWNFGLEGDYRFPEMVGLHAGIKVGIETADVTGSATDFVFGPQVGYDFHFCDALSIGPVVDYMFDLKTNRTNMFDAVADVKYHF